MIKKKLKQENEYLKERLRYMEEIHCFIMEKMERISSLGDFQESINNFHGPPQIFDQTRKRMQAILNFRATAFYLVNELDFDFHPVNCIPKKYSKCIDDEMGILIKDGTVARAIHEKCAVLTFSSDRIYHFLIHVMATVSRVRGLFVGILKEDAEIVNEASLKLLSIVMIHAANTLESFELYSRINTINQTLKNQNRLHSTILNNLTDMVFLTDTEGKITFYNNVVGNIFDISEKNKLEDIRLLWSDESADLVKEKLKSVIETKNIVYLDFKSYNKYFEMVLAPVLQNYKIVSIVCRVKDITERKKSERYLRHAYDDLKSTQAQLIQSGKLASIGELAAGVAHEINQPLMVIQGNAQIMQRQIKKGCLVEDLIQPINFINKNTKRMTKIIKHLRTFSRQHPIEFDKVNINQIIENCFLMLGEQLRINNIEVEKTYDDTIPFILGDANQLEQVALNLITNARDAMLHGGTLEIVTQKKNYNLQNKAGEQDRVTKNSLLEEVVEILFRDSGTGIDATCIDHIFDPFFTTKEVDKGTGLGLSISYGIIKKHRGEIDIPQTGISGTTFRVRLPIWEVA